jgi:hypothetical protein
VAFVKGTFLSQKERNLVPNSCLYRSLERITYSIEPSRFYFSNRLLFLKYYTCFDAEGFAIKTFPYTNYSSSCMHPPLNPEEESLPPPPPHHRTLMRSAALSHSRPSGQQGRGVVIVRLEYDLIQGLATSTPAATAQMHESPRCALEY